MTPNTPNLIHILESVDPYLTKESAKNAAFYAGCAVAVGWSVHTIWNRQVNARLARRFNR